MTYKLNVKESGNKAARFHYFITDLNGKIISERKSDRWYVAATIDGSFYFGRIDLIGKGDHAKQIKFAQGFGRNEKGKIVAGMFPPNNERLTLLNSIAFR